MTKYVATSSSYVHHVDFVVDGELVVPTAASYTLTKNDESVVNSLEDVTITLDEVQTGVNINIAGGANAKTLSYEVRYIDVSFTYEGNVYTVSDFYVIRDSIKLPLSKSAVRAVLGVTEGDIPDENIDLFSAYQEVQDDAGTSVSLDNVLQSGSALLPYMLDSIKLKAAIRLAVSIENSMVQMEQADNSLYQRFQRIDFLALRSTLVGMYDQSLRKLLGGDDPTTPVLSLLAFDVDAVTGV